MKFPILGKRSLTFSQIKPTGLCFGCGKPLVGRQKKYCSEKCSWDFFNNHNWNAFRNITVKERGEKCEDCGVKQYEVIKTHTEIWQGREIKREEHAELQVHHLHRIIDGGELCPNDQKAVIVVCRKCHGIRHRKTKPKKEGTQMEMAL